MSKQIVYTGQSFLNKVVECTGDVENAVAMAFQNGINISDDVAVGTELISSGVTKKNVFDFFNEDNKPATGYKVEEVNEVDNYGFPEGEFPFSF